MLCGHVVLVIFRHPIFFCFPIFMATLLLLFFFCVFIISSELLAHFDWLFTSR